MRYNFTDFVSCIFFPSRGVYFLAYRLCVESLAILAVQDQRLVKYSQDSRDLSIEATIVLDSAS